MVGVDLFGKSVDDLQIDIVVRDNEIIGTSHFVDDYESAGFDMNLGHNFIALKAEAGKGASISINTGDGEKTLDSDGIAIIQLRDDVTSIAFTVLQDGRKSVTTFNVKGIVKESK